MGIDLYNFKELHNVDFQQEINKKIATIISQNSFIEGEYNIYFEEEFAKLQQAKHCLLVANGTDALEISLSVANVKPGDKVGVPGITFYATAEAVLNQGAIPVFIDVDPESGLISPDSLKSMMQQHNLKAVIPVHIYGLPAPIKEIEAICTERDITIIEDAAQAQGTFLPDGPVGHTNNLVTFSFYPTKNLSTFGDAGAILTQNDQQAEKIKQIRNHGRGSTKKLGRNSRCDHIHAAVLHQKLTNIEQYNQNRRTIAAKYHESLKGLKVKTLPEKYLSTSSWHLYPIQLSSIEERIKLQKGLKAKNIYCGPYYEHSMSQTIGLTQFSGENKNANNFAGKTLCLPIHPFLSDSDVDTVAKAIKDILI